MQPAFESVRVRVPVAASLPAGIAMPKADRSIENLVIVLFWLLMFEGVLRKWVVPQFSQYLFFLRDPFVLLLYWHALRANAFRGAGLLLYIGVAFAFFAVILAFIQSVTFHDSRLFVVTAYGWRQYFLYLPLPFAMASTLNEDSLKRFARHAFIAVILTAPIAYLQFNSSPTSVINRGISEDEALQFKAFGLTADTIRPSGPFTSTVGIGNLVPSSLALLLALWLMPAKERKIGRPLLLLGAAATASCLALSGSRGAFVHASLVMLSALLVGVVARGGAIRTKALLIPVALIVTGAVLYPLIFPDALSALLTRLEAIGTAQAQAGGLGIISRALYETIDFVRLMGITPVTGVGLGLGGNGRSFLGPESLTLLSAYAAESEWSRHIVDLGPVVGVLFIVYRIGFTFEMFRRAIVATRVSASPLPLLLFGYIGVSLFYGQLTGHGTVGGFVWLYLGLFMASCRIAVER